MQESALSGSVLYTIKTKKVGCILGFLGNGGFDRPWTYDSSYIVAHYTLDYRNSIPQTWHSYQHLLNTGWSQTLALRHISLVEGASISWPQSSARDGISPPEEPLGHNWVKSNRNLKILRMPLPLSWKWWSSIECCCFPSLTQDVFLIRDGTPSGNHLSTGCSGQKMAPFSYLLHIVGSSPKSWTIKEVSCLTDTQNFAAYTKAPVQDLTRILITHLVVANITNKNQGTYFTSQNIQC